jgi:hypothetical protein
VALRFVRLAFSPITKGNTPMAKNEKTSSKVGSIAAQGLKSPGSLSKPQIKSLSASVLTQRPDHKGGKKK